MHYTISDIYIYYLLLHSSLCFAFMLMPQHICERLKVYTLAVLSTRFGFELDCSSILINICGINMHARSREIFLNTKRENVT